MKRLIALLLALLLLTSFAYADFGDQAEIETRYTQGWVSHRTDSAEEALAIAVYCALKYENDFDSALIAAVNHKGDSDSTGAICGNILGARLGLNGIPEKYITNLELKDLILEIADDLYHDCRMSEYDSTHDDPVWIQKYVKMTWPAGAEKKTEDIPKGTTGDNQPRAGKSS